MNQPTDSRKGRAGDLRCPECASALPVAFLREEHGDETRAWHALPARDLTLGRSESCDVQVGPDTASISRRHARLIFAEGGFSLEDAGSLYGTVHRGHRLKEGERVPLQDGDRLRLGDLPLRYQTLQLGASVTGKLPYQNFLRLVREMSSLDPATVVASALDLLRLVSGIERSLLVSAGSDPRLEALLTPLDDPALKVSRSSIEAALSRGEKLSRVIDPDDSGAMTESVYELNLRRIWVAPVRARAASPVAAVYLDSAESVDPLDEETERLMDAVVEQIGMALANASLHSELVSLNETLEEKVVERTAELEESRDLLVSQDRLATLGRLVAAIAHELNNPVGAMASFAETITELVEPLLGLGEAVATLFPDTYEARAARDLVAQALNSAGHGALDTRVRRQLTATLDESLRSMKIPGAGDLARRMARIGMEADALTDARDALAREGPALTALLEQVYTFGRGVSTIRSCADNVARIVSGLKTYSHLDQSQVEAGDIRTGLEAALTMLSSRIPAGVQVETHFDEIAPFPHRPGELTQVWTNLIDNACKAMGEQGRLTLAAHDEDDTVRIVVEDDGPGVPEELRSRIFELDVTTRGPGAGLGMGLPICRAIVEKKHGGTISCESRPGCTAFTVILPKKGPAAANEESGR